MNPNSPFLARARTPAALAVLAILAVACTFLPNQPVFATPGAYAAVHTALELLTVLFALGLFSAGWQAPRESRSLAYAILSGGFLTVAVLVFAHTLTFPGMPLAPAETKVTALLGSYARLVAAATLLIAAFEGAPRLRPRVGRAPILVVAAAMASGAGLLLMAPGNWGRYAWGAENFFGWTSAGGYLGALVYAAAGIAFGRRVDRERPWWPWWLAGGAFALALSEACLAQREVVDGVAHVAGHAFKVAGYGLIAWAVHGRAVREPAAALASNEERFRRLLRLTSDWYWEQDADGRFTLMQDDNRARVGVDPREYIGRTRRELLANHVVNFDWDAHEAILARREPFHDQVLEIHEPDGGERNFLSISGEPVFDDEGVFAGYRGTGRDITRQVKAERALREDDERWEMALVSAEHAVWDWNIVTGELRTSGTWGAQLGYGPGEVPDRLDEWESRIHPEDRSDALHDVARHVRGETAMYNNEYRLRCRDGTYKWMLDRGMVVARDRSGNPTRMVGTRTDITERRTMEERLRASEARFRATFQASPCSMAITDRETDALVDVNAAFERLHGVTRSQVLGNEGLKVGVWLDPRDRERSSALLREQGRVEAYPCQLRGADGKPVDVLIYAEIIDIGGRPMTLAQVIDISRLRAAERQLVENEQWLRAVTRRGPVPLAVIDFETRRFVEVNDMFSGLLGYGPDDVLGRSPREINLWAEPDTGERIYAEVAGAGRLPGRFAALRTRSGEVRECLLFMEVLSRNGKRVLVVQGVDFTERNAAERQLAEVSTRLTLATRAARIGIWDLDLARRRLLLDDTTLELLGVSREDFRDEASEWTRLLHPDDLIRAREQFEAVQRGRGDFVLQCRVVRPDGGVRHVHANARVERNARGVPMRLVGTVHDVTEMTQARQALARVNAELEARVTDRTRELRETIRELEAFSYTVAHDLRAPLRAIDGYSRFLEESLEAGDAEAIATYFAKIRRNVGGMDRLIDGLLGYARLGRQALARGSVDMSRVVDDVVSAASEQYPHASFAVGPLPPARGDAAMLRQVWENLVGNACKFSSKDGPAVIEIGSEDGPNGPAYFVRDNGVGFDMRHAGKLFQVFERLHVDPRYPGTGIGLATVQRIVQRHGGHAWAEGRPGEGATFRFRIAA